MTMGIRRILCLAVALAFCVAFGRGAVAQQSQDGTAPSDAAASDSTAMQSAREKGIAVIEPRPFGKSGRWEAGIGLGTIASDIFLVYLPVTVRGAYHFREWVSLEVSGSFMGCFSDDVGADSLRASGQRCMRFTTPGYDRLRDDGADMAQVRSATLMEYSVARVAANSVFSFLMGKFTLGQGAIGHFDLNATAGLGVQIMERPDENEHGAIRYGASFEGNFGLGLRFVFVDFVSVRLDFREYLFGHLRDKGLGTASELTLGVSFLFPSRREP